jgi:two-component system chemotaxis sensor kinase CheA
LLPLVYLDRELQLEASGRSDSADTETSGDPGAVNIVVLQADDRPFGLVVDAVHDTEEIVVKPLQKQVKGITTFAGATIMGDGKVALILDVLGLAQHARILTGSRGRTVSEPSTAPAEPAADRATVVLFATNDGGRMAIPLALVDRLEEFPRSIVEQAGSQDVVQYRDEILPLVHVSRVLSRLDPVNPPPRAKNERAVTETDALQVVVVAGKSQRVGLVVDRIVDIAEEALVVRSNTRRPGVLFTAVIQGRITEFLDVEAVLRFVESDGLEPAQTTAAEE